MPSIDQSGVSDFESFKATYDQLVAVIDAELTNEHKSEDAVDFEAQLPRLETGKLYKRLLRDRYWGNTSSGTV